MDDREAYAVYAAVLRSGFSLPRPPVLHLAVMRETRRHLACGREESITSEWRPVWEHYKTANSGVRTLLPHFDLELPYVVINLVSVDEVHRLLVQAGRDGKTARNGWPEAHRSFPNGRLVTFSAVGFDESKTRAWVTVQYNYGLSPNPDALEHDCHEGQHIVLVKEAGSWVQSQAMCEWMV